VSDEELEVSSSAISENAVELKWLELADRCVTFRIDSTSGCTMGVR